MSRYLNPAKACLLVLVELYTEGNVPSEATLPVLSFVISHLMERSPTENSADQTSRWSKAERTVGLIITIKDFEKLLGGRPFHAGAPGRTLWDEFLTKLWDVNSLHAFKTFFENLPHVLAWTKEERDRLAEMGELTEEEGIKLSPGSPLGLFIRRACLEYQRLQFHDGAELWKSFVRYRQPTANYLKRKIPGFERLSFDNVVLLGEKEGWERKGTMDLVSVVYGDILEGDRTSTLPVTTDDIEILLEFQIAQMQKYGNRVPLEIRHQFHDLLNDSHIIPSLTHYLCFLDAWRAGDYPTAFDSLHQYFDYTMQNRDRLFYQYALMNLAVLQADFGCYKDAVTSMLETVTTARENNDMTCLNFALNWLFHFGRAHPSLVRHLESQSLLGTGKDSLAFLRVKAKETGMWTLWSSVLLSEANLGLVSGDSVATAWEYVFRSSQVIVENNLKNMFGSQLSMLSALWDRLGVSTLGNMMNDIFLQCHVGYCIFDDELKVSSRIAMQLMSCGKYDEALKTLESLDENSMRSWMPRQYWHKYRNIIQLRRCLVHDDLERAEGLVSLVMQSNNDDLEPEITFTFDTLHIDYLTRRGDLQAATAKIDAMMTRLREDKKDVAYRVRLLLLKAALLDRCGRPLRGFTTAMRAASIAWRTRIIPSLWQAVGAIANVLVSLGEFEAASHLLLTVIPRSLESDGVSITAQLYTLLIDAKMGLAGQQAPKSKERGKYMTEALDAVQKAFTYYSRLEDIKQQCQLMAKKAMIMKLSGDKKLAADCAATYLQLQEKADAYRLGDE
ncbi:anaphase-promoting complex subunit 5-domain-containing protein [Mariannaea sp. PMI_226]|nr:anaphase-promoting complex subunit 5-domain-containing protein [Mariannaea sp. PMI_226]